LYGDCTRDGRGVWSLLRSSGRCRGHVLIGQDMNTDIIVCHMVVGSPLLPMEGGFGPGYERCLPYYCYISGLLIYPSPPFTPETSGLLQTRYTPNHILSTDQDSIHRHVGCQKVLRPTRRQPQLCHFIHCWSGFPVSQSSRYCSRFRLIILDSSVMIKV
jgi:hypothetical protein